MGKKETLLSFPGVSSAQEGVCEKCHHTDNEGSNSDPQSSPLPLKTSKTDNQPTSLCALQVPPLHKSHQGPLIAVHSTEFFPSLPAPLLHPTDTDAKAVLLRLTPQKHRHLFPTDTDAEPFPSH